MTVESPTQSSVLVSGASGYLGSHCVRALLEEGYRVRGTVRSLKVHLYQVESLKNESKVAPVRLLDKEGRLELVEADLLKPDTWNSALTGVDYVLHVASPFVLNADANTIKTAVDGTLNVLKAASKQPTVKKVVLTSSVAAVSDGVDWRGKTFDEKDWSKPENSKDDYSRSKTFAERAAWEFHETLPKDTRFALTTLNPSLIIGPLLINEEGTSALLIKQILEHKYPALPKLQFGLVDVRDVATAHVRALSRPASDGQRIIVSGYSVRAMTAPNLAICFMSLFDSGAKAARPNLSKELRLNNSRVPPSLTKATFQSKSLLDLEYRDVRRSLLEMAYSMIERGLAKKTSKYRGLPFDMKLP